MIHISAQRSPEQILVRVPFEKEIFKLTVRKVYFLCKYRTWKRIQRSETVARKYDQTCNRWFDAEKI